MTSMISALVVGFGLIGQRHTARLDAMGSKVVVCNRRKFAHDLVFDAVANALSKMVLEYIAIASRMYGHARDLSTLAKFGCTEFNLVEKPISDYRRGLSDQEGHLGHKGKLDAADMADKKVFLLSDHTHSVIGRSIVVNDGFTL